MGPSPSLLLFGDRAELLAPPGDVRSREMEMTVTPTKLCKSKREEKELEVKGGGRKLALQNGKVEGSEVGKNTALFLEAVARSSRRQDALHKLGGANDSR